MDKSVAISENGCILLFVVVLAEFMADVRSRFHANLNQHHNTVRIGCSKIRFVGFETRLHEVPAIPGSVRKSNTGVNSPTALLSSR